MTQLQYIDVTNNANLYGDIPDDMFEYFINLIGLHLSFNSFSGALPLLPKNDGNLLYLDMSSNRFNGKIPDSYFIAPNLQLLSVSQNCLSRELPSSICNSSSSITYLYLAGLQQGSHCPNYFAKGANVEKIEIPSCVWSLSSLREFYITGNAYIGDLDDNGFNLSNIVKFGISANRIGGTIPTMLHGMSMEYFDVSNNHIAGSLEDLNLNATGVASGTT